MEGKSNVAEDIVPRPDLVGKTHKTNAIGFVNLSKKIVIHIFQE